MMSQALFTIMRKHLHYKTESILLGQSQQPIKGEFAHIFVCQEVLAWPRVEIALTSVLLIIP